MNSILPKTCAALGAAAFLSAASYLSAQESFSGLLASWEFEDGIAQPVAASVNPSAPAGVFSSTPSLTYTGTVVEGQGFQGGSSLRFNDSAATESMSLSFGAGSFSSLEDLSLTYRWTVTQHTTGQSTVTGLRTQNWNYTITNNGNTVGSGNLGSQTINQTVAHNSAFNWELHSVNLAGIVLNEGDVLTLTTAFSNALNQTGNVGSYVDAIQFSGGATVIPEPSTYAAMFGALVLLGVFVRRRYSK